MSSRLARGLASSFVLAALAGCGGVDDDSSQGDDEQRADLALGGDVVSVVEGHRITRSEVEAAARLAGVEPATALAHLQEEALLEAAARRAGHSLSDREAGRALRQAAVQQLLLEEVEATVGPDSVDEARVLERFDAELQRFERPERRASTHLLARLPRGAPPPMVESGRLYIEGQIARAAASPNAASALLSVARQLDDGTPFELEAEEVPGLARRSGADPAYLRALFEAEGPGLLPEPVRTGYGWHAMVVSEIEPAVEVSREDALAQLRGEELARLRAARLDELVRELSERDPVEVNRQQLLTTFADPHFMAEP